jgi:hypothetical protein
MSKKVDLTLPSIGQTLGVIGIAIVFGLVIDQAFERLFGTSHPLARIVLQFAIITVVIALVQRYLPFDLIGDIFFISIFFAVQQYLFLSIRRIQLFPWPPHLAPFEYIPT